MSAPLLSALPQVKPQIMVQWFLMMTLLAVVPTMLMLTTSFIRNIIVLGFVRQAVGQPQVPPQPVIVAMALFLTYFSMNPVFTEINTKSLQPYLKGSITETQAMESALTPLRASMLKRTRRKDLLLFVHLAHLRPASPAEVPIHVLIPAFVSSELRAAFSIGFLIFLPFLVIDIVVASVLMSMGMMMIPPTVISLPVKLLLFVLIDGWNLILRGLVLGAV
jgi:flagellar biosynthetic protein FliP